MCERVFLIQCLKRSKGKGMLIFWEDNYQGYTSSKKLAGKYPAEALAGAAGAYGDWIAHPTWIECEARAKGEWC